MKPLRLLLSFWLLSGFAVTGQEKSDGLVRIVGPGRCYENGNLLDMLAQDTPPDKLIIVIARVGENEARANLNRRRLHNVRTYWTEYLYDKRKPETIILAEGEKVKDLGRLEFYVGGKMVAALKLRRNADLIAANCYPEPEEGPCPHIERNFYPCLGRHLTRRKSR